MIPLSAVGADGVEAPSTVIWIWLGALAVVTVAVIAVTVVWTRRARRQGTSTPPTAEAENDPAGGRSRGLRVSATVVLGGLSALLVLALLAFTGARVVDLLA